MVRLLERHSRYLLVLPLLGATTRRVVAARMVAFQQLPPARRRSLTWDRGVEMTRHAEFTAATGIPVCFRNATALTAGQQREQQRPAAAVLSKENRPIPA